MNELADASQQVASSDDYVKFHVTYSGDDQFAGESMWATYTDTENFLRVANIPFFAEGMIAMDDIVEVKPAFDDETGEELLPEFVRVVKRSGNVVVLAIFDDSLNIDVIGPLVDQVNKDHAAKSERGFGTLFAFNVEESRADDLWYDLVESGFLDSGAYGADEA